MTSDEAACVLAETAASVRAGRLPLAHAVELTASGRDVVAEAWAACRDPRAMSGLYCALLGYPRFVEMRLCPDASGSMEYEFTTHCEIWRTFWSASTRTLVASLEARRLAGQPNDAGGGHERDDAVSIDRPD